MSEYKIYNFLSSLYKGGWTNRNKMRAVALLVLLVIIGYRYWVEGDKSAFSSILSNDSTNSVAVKSNVPSDTVAVGSADFDKAEKVKVIINRVIDGDTVEYLVGSEKHVIRLIGVNTPETVHPSKPVECFGKEASNFTKKSLERQQVYLSKDSFESGTEKYGRELRYVWTVDGQLFNATLIKEGYGFATPEYHFEQKENFINWEKEARMSEKGLWNKEVCKY